MNREQAVVTLNPRAEHPDDERAYALMQDATAHSNDGRWLEAAAHLEEAATIHRRRGRPYDAARCLQLAASLHRMAGDTTQAAALLDRALAVSPPDEEMDEALGVSIMAEQGEIALAEQRFGDALAAYGDAVDAARRAGFGPEALSALLRRRGFAGIGASDVDVAEADYTEAYRLLLGHAGLHTAAFVRTEQADALWQAGDVEEMGRVVADVQDDLAGEAGDWGAAVPPHLRAELGVALARLARSRENWTQAAEEAKRAREAALEAVAPVSYFAAAVELAEALQAQGRLPEAYRVLATAYGTLSDAIGEAGASSWVEPVLAGYQARWGEAAFQQAKQEYERGRRQELGKNATAT